MSDLQPKENVEKFGKRAVTFWEKAQKYLFMRHIIRIFSQGIFFKKVYGVFLKVIAVATAITGAVLWVRGWVLISEMSRYSEAAGIIIGGFIVEVLLIIFLYACVHTLWLRAVEIENLPETGYAVIPIIATSFKLAGDLYAVISVFLGLASAVLIWFTGETAAYILPFIEPGRGFFAGLISLLMGLGIGLLALVGLYFLSEMTIVLVDIAGRLQGKKELPAGE
ncbi:MAG: hypothetical protein GX085_08635 [Firmicutes bacterium]|jgi:hypothetical protein|nr:hypothetical protein [Bacillota bacterium]